MKRIFFLLFVSTCLGSSAQNWKLFNSGRVDWFDGNPWVFDSILVANGDTSFIDSIYDGSSIKTEIYTELANGNYWIISSAGDSIPFLRHSTPGTVWNLYKDANGYLWKYQHTKTEIGIIIGMSDSLKYYDLLCYENKPPFGYSLKSKSSDEIILSKNHGLKRYYSRNRIYVKSGLNPILKYGDIYDYQPGDEVQWYEHGNYPGRIWEFMEVLERHDSINQIRYKVRTTTQSRQVDFSTNPPTSVYLPRQIIIENKTFTNTDSFILNGLPERFFWSDSLKCYVMYSLHHNPSLNTIVLSDIYYFSKDSAKNQFHQFWPGSGGRSCSYKYLVGLGIEHGCGSSSGQQGSTYFFNDIIYAKKNGIKYGQAVWLGIDDNSLEENVVSISPNPAGNQFSLNFKQAMTPNLKVSLLNSLGQQFELSSQNLQNYGSYDISSHPPGLYFVQLKDNGNVKVMKLVISR